MPFRTAIPTSEVVLRLTERVRLEVFEAAMAASFSGGRNRWTSLTGKSP